MVGFWQLLQGGLAIFATPFDVDPRVGPGGAQVTGTASAGLRC